MKTFEGVVFAMLRGPQHIPLGHAIGVPEAIRIEDLMNQLAIFTKGFEEQLWMVDDGSLHKIVDSSVVENVRA